ncbi:MAG: PAAR domain-containing protein [Armatimonadota bacterium]
MPKVARVGDSTSHGGSITSGAAFSFANGQAIARIGDSVSCPEHGDGTIVSGSDSVSVEGSPVARVGDSTSCGASITSGSSDVEAG